jgi:hypothetical protein
VDWYTSVTEENEPNRTVLLGQIDAEVSSWAEKSKELYSDLNLIRGLFSQYSYDHLTER